ncbi:MAG TPA: pyridoxamine 5'-phosphate oxidase [Gaiellaceae bacterium]|nr:pyridoxamine 5'-phosphate oxidase [Gaiellaceae bacterium]
MSSEPPFAQPLRRGDLDPDPLRQFQTWFEAAQEAGVTRPETVALATATPEGRPSVRFVLLKSAGDDGFVFYSGYESRKGRELAANPRAALCFYWHELGRQVRVEGPVARVELSASDAYFASRPAGARLSATASRQGRVVASRCELATEVERLNSQYGDGPVPRPDFWGGFSLMPVEYEFWQHREDRLHDRFRYRPDGDGWAIERLSP